MADTTAESTAASPLSLTLRPDGVAAVALGAADHPLILDAVADRRSPAARLTTPANIFAPLQEMVLALSAAVTQLAALAAQGSISVVVLYAKVPHHEPALCALTPPLAPGPGVLPRRRRARAAQICRRGRGPAGRAVPERSAGSAGGPPRAHCRVLQRHGARRCGPILLSLFTGVDASVTPRARQAASSSGLRARTEYGEPSWSARRVR